MLHFWGTGLLTIFGVCWEEGDSADSGARKQLPPESTRLPVDLDRTECPNSPGSSGT